MIAAIFAVLMLITQLTIAVEINTNNPNQTTMPYSFLGLTHEEGHMVEQTSDGGYIIIGSLGLYKPKGIWLIKLNTEGKKEWEKNYVGNFGYGVQQTSDGGFILAGADETSYTLNRIILIKTDEDGNMQWRNSYEGWFQEFYFPDHVVKQTSDGGYVVIGTVYGGPNGAVLIKIDKDGTEQWRKNYGFNDESLGRSILQTDDNGFIVLATGETPTSDLGQIFLFKTDNNGNIEWSKMFNKTEYEYVGATSIDITNDGGYIIGGHIETDYLEYSGWIIKTDEYGNIQWEKQLDEYSCEVVWSIEQTKDNGYIIADGRPYDGIVQNSDLLKLDENGDVEWHKTIESYSNECHCVRQTSDDGFIFTGVYYDESLEYVGKLLVIKTDEYGNIEWQLSKQCVRDSQPTNQFLQRFLELFPNAFPILRQLLGL